MSLSRLLTDEARFHRQLDRLAARARGKRVDRLAQGGVSFSALLHERERVVALLRRAIADASFRPAPARISRMHIAGRQREMAHLGALDQVVQGVLAEVLSELLEERLSPHVYSYRRGRSPWQALRSIASLARDQRGRTADPRDRGLFVFRGDVSDYTDSIPLAAGGMFWRDLSTLLATAQDDPLFVMIRAVLQPPIESEDGAAPARARERGLLFGAPTTNALANMHLMALDTGLASLGGAYVRFGDDVLFAHESPGTVRDGVTTMQAILSARALRLNETKRRVFFWNGAARTSEAWPEAQGVRDLPFLGAAIRFDGTIGLSPAKWTALLRELHARIERTSRLLDTDAPKARAKILAGVMNDAFDVRSELCVREAALTVDLVSDRAQLAQLDYWVARWVAEAATKKRGPRAFRAVPYWWLRRGAKLASRVVARNG